MAATTANDAARATLIRLIPHRNASRSATGRISILNRVSLLTPGPDTPIKPPPIDTLIVSGMAPPTLIRVGLGAAGLVHAMNRLERDKPLRRALSQLDLDQGDVWTWAASGTTFTLEDLRDGGLPDGITQESHRDAVAGFVAAYLQQPRRLAIVEDHDASPNDPWLADEPVLPPRLGFGNHLYWYAANPDRALIDQVIRWGFGLFKCMALIRLADQWPPAGPVVESDIENLAASTDHFVVDAFDFEGFMVWSRQRSD